MVTLSHDKMSALSVKQAICTATPRQDAANEYQRTAANLGFAVVRPRKGRQDVGAFRSHDPAAGSRD